MGRKGANHGPDAALARIAARQHGVITTAQLLSVGVHSSGIAKRVDAGRLHRIHRRVYAVGHTRLSDKGRWMAAVLACGEDAVLSHRSAGKLWGILRPRRRSAANGRGEESTVHITVPGAGGRKRHRGISLHRSSTLTPADCIRCDGIPVTKPARTLADLRPMLSEAAFASAVREAEFLRLPIGDDQSSVGDGARRRDSSKAPRTRTELESMLMALARRHRLVKPEVNVKVDRYEVDFLWRDQRLIAEVDGWESHGTRSAFEEDRARDARLTSLGYAVVRFTWHQVDREPQAVAQTIRNLLAARG
jgi:very-short-patch-repair endonuclease